ncbi:chromosome segregation protein SMC [Jeotgalibaca sp. A127]|uniref:chromosome segregation protein SMC n=1 Tax=Jeotgalibaca sp. A127 TaxID=3457324 RepID=UPI003FCF38D6
MHLERIEMTGFKSFADKTVIEFDKGVTAIVGPNGSGKSNLSEAVRWVLGEQSAKNLRGKKMNDIVFAGSQSRKPINIAEVTLVFNNEDRSLPIDFSEVSLTRRINRNGDSDCFINRKPCRLKDITDLLMDSGVGKDSFSMISQGKVEQIFQNKPEERRAIFEDAAGVAKYKNRKTSAQRKLTETMDHLNRVQDILHEIDNQLIPLGKQRDTALAYQEKNTQLSKIEIALLAFEITNLNNLWQDSKKEIESYQKKVANEEKQQISLKEDLAALKHNASLFDRELNEFQDEYVATIRKIEQLEGQKNILAQKANFSAKNKEEQGRILQEKQDLIETETLKAEELSKELKEKASVRKALQSEITSLSDKEKQFSQDKNQWLQEIRDTYIEKLQVQSMNKNTILQNEREYAHLTERNAVLIKRLKELKDKIEQSQSAVERDTQIIKQKTSEQANTDKKLQKLMETLNTSEATFAEYNRHLNELVRSIQQAEARRESQQELEDSYASYYQGVKEILKRKDVIPGIHGPVGELFQVPETYTLAIDTALGNAIQNIVVDNPQTASKAIQVLKANRLGRATFYPLTVIKGRQIPDYVKHDLKNQPGFIGIGSELISYEPTYAEIAANLLGTTIISQDLDSGLAIAKSLDNRFRIVSLDGDVIHAGGSMTGGATKRQQGNSVFSRKNSIEKLTVFIEEKTREYQQLEQKHQALSVEVEGAQQLKETLQSQTRQVAFELEKVKENFSREQELLKDLQKEYAAEVFEQKQINQQHEEVETILAQARKQRDNLAVEVERLKQDMADSTMNEEERQKLLQKIQSELSQKQQELAVLKEQEKQLRRDIDAAQEIISKEKMTIQAIEENIELVSKQETNEFQTVEEVLQSLEQAYKRKDELDSVMDDKRTKKHNLDEQSEAKNNELNQLSANIQAELEKLARFESQAGRLESSIDHHLNRLNEAYGLNYEAAVSTYTLTMPETEAKIAVNTLKKEITDLGPINMAAIEEYNRIAERYDFLKQQQTDLLTARQSLLDTMEEMDEEVSQRFLTTFNAIKEQFEKTFPKLFGGGKATIALSDENNILETGIEIIAQPPGKKLQQLSLLSGGEKAFTAIALLFAIIEVSPVPFCILDEVEAALDEANVVRFGKYLASFEKETQFIVITHRKGTMEEADVLYGVTMQDSGVSRLASVKFGEYEEE